MKVIYNKSIEWSLECGTSIPRILIPGDLIEIPEHELKLTISLRGYYFLVPTITGGVTVVGILLIP